LVLHGGGSAGNAWEIGVIAGLFNAGVDVTEADLIIGTSAGATAAAQVTNASPADLLTAILDAPSPRQGSTGRPSGGPPPVAPVVDHMERTNRIIAASKNAADMRRRMGAAALELDAAPDGSGQDRWRSVVAARLPSHRWPERAILITAVDANTGESVVFNRLSGVDLVDAVAASTANGFGVPPFGIGDDRFIDGGYRRTRMPIWQPDTSGFSSCRPSAAGRGIPTNGECSLLPRSTSFAPAAAPSRRSSPITAP